MDSNLKESDQINNTSENITILITEPTDPKPSVTESINQESSNADHFITIESQGESLGCSVNVERTINISDYLEVQTSSETTTTKNPNTLYAIALSKIQDESLRRAVQIITDENQNVQQIQSPINNDGSKESGPELKTPESLGDAPPSYSFVLRQVSHPRPRLMGTFIPSPSFVLHTPPPNYATAFDIYIDNPMPHPTRTYRFGYMPMYIICPACGYIGVTTIVTKIIMSTHLCALVLCLLCCWACAPLPYILRSCKEVHHYCSNCRVYVGMYCPTSPENTTSRT